MSKIRKWKFYHRKVLVSRVQWKLVGIIATHFVLVIVIFLGALYTPIVMRLGSGDISSPEVQGAAREFLTLHTRLWIPLLGAFALLLLHNVLVTHRIAGPLWRFRRYLKAVGDGDLSSSISFREKDYLQEDAEVATHMVKSLRDKIAHLGRQIGEANRVWGNVRSSLPAGISTGHAEDIDEMNAILTDCEAALAEFTTEKKLPSPAESEPKAPAKPVEVEV